MLSPPSWSWREVRDQCRLAFPTYLTPDTRSRKPSETANPITRADYEPSRLLALASQPRRSDMALAQLKTAYVA